MKEIVTSDLAEFGSRERQEVISLLTAWREQGLPADFYDEEVRPMMNKNSGYVFLSNNEYQVAMMNGTKLEIWNSCPNCGAEGFDEDCSIDDNGECNECAEPCDDLSDAEECEEARFDFESDLHEVR